MLDDQDRMRLAPAVARLRGVSADLTAARGDLAAVEAVLRESEAATDWRDRRLGGLLSVDGDRARRYHAARREHRVLTARVAELEAVAERHGAEVDALLAPLLRAKEPAYRLLEQAVEQCDRALRECTLTLGWIQETSAAVRAAIKAATMNPATAARAPDTELIASRYDAMLRATRESLPGLRDGLTATVLAVTRATGIKVSHPPLPDPDLLAGLTGGMASAAQRVELRHGLGPLHTIGTHIRAWDATITRWRTRVEESRQASVREFRDRL